MDNKLEYKALNKRLRRDHFSVYIFNYLLQRRSQFLPRPKDAAKSAVEYADALIEELDKNNESVFNAEKIISATFNRAVNKNEKYY
jgi:hypothetical protein